MPQNEICLIEHVANVWQHNRNGRFGNCLSCPGCPGCPARHLFWCWNGAGNDNNKIDRVEVVHGMKETRRPQPTYQRHFILIDMRIQRVDIMMDRLGTRLRTRLCRRRRRRTVQHATCNVQQQQSVTTFAVGDAFVMWPRIAIAKAQHTTGGRARKGEGKREEEGAPLFICVMSEPPLMKSEAEAIEIEIDNNNKKAKRNRNRIQNQERESGRETGRRGDGECCRQMASLRFPSVFNINFHCLAGLVYCVLLQRVSGLGSGLDWVLVGAVVTQSAHDLRIRCAIWT